MSRILNRLRGRVYGWFDSKDSEPEAAGIPGFSRKARLVLTALEDRAVPATFTVFNTNDSGTGTLRQAILEANANPGADTILFNTDPDLGTDFDAGTNTIAVPTTLGSLASAAGESITITGPGADKLLVFKVPSAISFNFLSVGTVTGGPNTVSLSGMTLASFSSTSAGGTISIGTGNNFTMNDVTIQTSTSSSSSGGSAILLNAGVHTISNSTIIANKATSTASTTNTNGGAIRITSTTAGNSVTINNSTIAANSGVVAGAINASGFAGTLNVNNSTIVDNVATISAGSVAAVGWGAGGISRPTTTTPLMTVNLNNSILNNVAAASGRNDLALNGTAGSGYIVNAANSIISDHDDVTYPTGANPPASNKTGVVADLTSFGYHNNAGKQGSTPVFVPLPASVAVGNGVNTFGSTDQTGQTRTSPFDIGAVDSTNTTPHGMLVPLTDEQSFIIPTSPAVNGSFPFSVNFYDDTGFAANTFSTGNDYEVVAPNGAILPVTYVSETISGNTATINYQFNPPGGASWTGADNGLYSIRIRANEVQDTSGNTALAGLESAFLVALSAPTATAAAANVTAAGGTSHTVKVTYTDANGFNASSIEPDDIRIIASTGISITPSSVSFVDNGTTLTAQYTFTAPGGTWDTNENAKRFTIVVQGNEVANSLGVTMPAGVPVNGSFVVRFAETFVVNTTADTVDANPAITSLREAVAAANVFSENDDTIMFDPSVFAGAQTIELNSTLAIPTSVNIVRPVEAATVTIAHATGVTGHILNLANTTSNHVVNLTNIRLLGHTAFGAFSALNANDETVTLTNVTITGVADGTGDGAGITGTTPTITLNNSTVNNNKTTGAGGGIYIDLAGNLMINNSTIDGNSATANGGGIRVGVGSTVNITGTTISNNTVLSSTATGIGGGLWANNSSNVSILRSTFDSNFAGASGAGIGMTSTTAGTGQSLTVFDSTISRNSTSNTSGTGGGGIHYAGVLNATGFIIRNSTIAGNFGSRNGGGILLATTNGTFTITNSTIVNNVANPTVTTLGTGGGGIAWQSTSTTASSTLNLVSNIISGNSANVTNPSHDVSFLNSTTATTTTVINATYNAVGDQDDFTRTPPASPPTTTTINFLTTDNAGTNLTPANSTYSALKLTSPSIDNPAGLGSNGGPTKTVALGALSSAFGTGDNSAGLAFDQTGITPRVFAGFPDIGAFERVPGDPVATIGPLTKIDITNYTGLNPYQFTVTYSDDTAINGATINQAGIVTINKVGGGFNTNATIVGAPPSGTAPSYVVTYQFNAPGGGWDFNDNGSYSIDLADNKVLNSGGNDIEGASLGNIIVGAPKTFTVTNGNADGAGSFRAAVAAANADSVTDIINFDPALSNQVNIVNLSGTEVLISEAVQINGPGADKFVLNAGGSGRVMNINNASTVINVSVSNLGFTGGNVSGSGGGIQTQNETVTLRGIHVYGNTASSDGGGISALTGGNITILDSAVTGNKAANGGGVAVTGASGGGGTIRNTTIANNIATSTSGGGGIAGLSWSTAGFLNIFSSTIVNNTNTGSGSEGGGIRLSSATGATLNLTSTVVADNSITGTGTIFGFDIAVGTLVGTVGPVLATKSAIGTTDGYNLDPSSSGNVDPTVSPILLKPLNFNGGGTPTIAFDPASSLRNAGTSAEPFDQRGSSRTLGGGVDIGAYELKIGQPHSVTKIYETLNALPTPANSPYSFSVDFTNDSPDDVSLASLVAGSIRVYGPNGFSTLATLDSKSQTSSQLITGNYSFLPPGGTWDQNDAGIYTFVHEGNLVKSSALSPVPNEPAPVAVVGTLTINTPKTFLVTNTNDSGTGSLRQAVIDANLNKGFADTVEFSSLFDTPQTITLTGGEIAITDSLIVDGPGINGKDLVTVSGNNASRIFNIDNGVAATSAGGLISVTIQDVKLTNGSTAASGGAVSIQDENVTFLRTIFSNNQAAIDGGAVNVIEGINNNVTFENSLLMSNSAVTASTASGGAINIETTATITAPNVPMQVVLRNTTLAGNTAKEDGGGLAMGIGPQITVDASTISGNTTGIGTTGGAGGGMYFITGTTTTSAVNILNTTISGNYNGSTGTSSSSGAGGLAFNSVLGDAYIQNSTIVNNTAIGSASTSSGGFSSTSSANLRIHLNSTIISNNVSANGPDDFGTPASLAGTAAVNIFNSAIGDATGFAITTSGDNLFGENLLLGALADNGGPTQTHLPGGSSPVLGRGSNVVGLVTDQRGFQRSLGTTDIGSVEVIPTRPYAELLSVDAPVSGQPTTLVTIRFGDIVSGLNSSTLNNGDEILVTRPDGSTQNATFVGFVGPSGNGSSSITAQFSFSALGGTWGPGAGGLYAFSLIPGGVSSFGGVPSQADPVGNFAADFVSTFTVTNTNNAGAGSLRQALLNSNATPNSNDTIVFSPTTFATPQTITLAGELFVTDDVIIDGGTNGKDRITVSGNNASRIFNISNSIAGTPIDVTIQDLRLANGSVSGGNGGAILMSDENVTLRRMTVTNSAVSGTSSSGGGIAVTTPNNNTLTVEDSLITLNTAVSSTTSDGGAIHSNNPATGTEFTLVVRRSTLSSNTVNDDGGGINLGAASNTAKFNFLMESSTISGNVGGLTSTTGDGGGVYFRGEVGSTGFRIRNSTVSGNSANTSGTGSVNGGGLAFPFINGTVFVVNSTITNNTSAGSPTGAGQGGGGISINRPSVSAPPALLVLDGSIVAGNSAASGRSDIASQDEVDMQYSAVGDADGFTPTAVSGTIGANVPLGDTITLGALANNGGPTLTHLPLSANLINTGNNLDSLAVDQRGLMRSVGQTDMGSVELQSALAVVTGFVVNDGAPQRSRLTKVVVNFASPVDLAQFQTAGAVFFTRTGVATNNVEPVGTVVNSGNGLLVAPASGFGTSITITFDNIDNAGIDNGSLSDGRWQLSVVPAGYTSPNTPADTQLRRLFGDLDNNGTVDGVDFSAFPPFSNVSGSAFDFDNNNAIDANDFAAFGGRNGYSLV